MIIPDIAEYEDTDSELAKYTITNLHHEIGKLKKENKELNKICARKSHYIDKKDLEITQKDLEIERLNNIINELEDTLINKIRQIDERIKKDKIKPYGIEFELNECAKNRYREMLDKIKEFKGEDKEC